jgi:hypothetical protein
MNLSEQDTRFYHAVQSFHRFVAELQGTAFRFMQSQRQ